MFRPATHRRELLAGRTVTLRAACGSCGETLSVEWAMPNADALVREQVAHQHAERALPLAAGAEEWAFAQSPADVHDAPDVQERRDRPVTSLGDWRMRVAQPAATTSADAVAEAAMEPYLNQFSSRVELAREHLRRASTDLPSAVAPGDREAFRTPKLSRDSAAPTAAPIAAPSFAPADSPDVAPVVEAAVEEPVAPAPVVDAAIPVDTPEVAVAIAAAVESPSFHDDSADPMAAAPEAAPAPSLVHDVAPTDADVFPPAMQAPPAPVEAPAPQDPVAPEQPEPAEQPVAPVGDAAANVWGELPVSPVAAPAPAAPAPAPATPAPPAAPSMPEPAPVATEPTFADAFADAAATTAPATPQVSPEFGGAPVTQPTPDAAPDADEDRGFDWGPSDSERPAKSQAKARAKAKAKAKAKARAKGKVGRGAPARQKPVASDADPAFVAGPEVVFEPSAEAAVKPRVSISAVHLVLIVLLAVIGGLAVSKIIANRGDASSDPTAVVTPTTESLAVDPATSSPTTPPKKGATGAKSGTPRTPAASKTSQATGAASATTPAATSTAPAGSVASDNGSTGLEQAANAASNETQVTAAPADTADVNVSSTDDSNPFARPQ